MKQQIRLAICCLLALAIGFPAWSAAESASTAASEDLPTSENAAPAGELDLVLYIDSTHAYVQGERKAIPADAYPLEQDGIVYVPVRFVAEQLGFDVSWLARENKAVISGNGVSIELTKDSATMFVNGEARSLPARIPVIHPMMYVPLEPYAGALGFDARHYAQGLILIGRPDKMPDPDADAAVVAELADLFAKPLSVTAVTASSHDGNIPENTLDGRLDTRWSAEGDGEWIAFDLGSLQTIGYFGIAFYNGDQRKSAFDLEVSVNGSEWRRVYSGESSGVDNDIETVRIEPAEARYVRYIGHGNTVNAWNSLTEFQVYAPNPAGYPVRKIGAAPAENPAADPFTQPGLVNPDGTPHPVPEPNPVTGRTLNVVDFGADPADNDQDDAAAIQTAIAAAQPGDEVYFPNGIYNLLVALPNDQNTHLELKSGVNLRGESEEGAVLKASLEGQSTKLAKAFAKSNITISHLTFTSDWNGQYSSDPKVKNPDVGGPQYLLYLADSGGKPSSYITVEHVTFEKFERMAVRIEESNNIVVRASTFRNATDVAGGGAGYGVSIQGVPKTDRLGFENDTYFNVVEDCVFEGPYIRHGVLIQYVAHNNLIRNNVFRGTVLDAIDLHGEDEYLNEITGNVISDVLTGAGIGVGNTGGTAPSNHDASGPFNYIHHNTIINSREGIKVHMGSPDTVIENNTITGTTIPNARGIYLLNAPRTVVRNNTIEENTADGFWGIYLDHDEGDPNTEDHAGRGDPKDIVITGNRITGNTNGVYIGETATGIVLKDNDISGNLVEDLIVLGSLADPVDLSQGTFE